MGLPCFAANALSAWQYSLRRQDGRRWRTSSGPIDMPGRTRPFRTRGPESQNLNSISPFLHPHARSLQPHAVAAGGVTVPAGTRGDSIWRGNESSETAEGSNASSTASNQIELSGYSTWLTRSYHAQSRVTKERNTDDHETENPQSTGGRSDECRTKSP